MLVQCNGLQVLSAMAILNVSFDAVSMNAITVGNSTESNIQACLHYNDNKRITIYSGVNDFTQSDKIYEDINGNTLCQAGWYSNGVKARNWNGVKFLNEEDC